MIVVFTHSYTPRIATERSDESRIREEPALVRVIPVRVRRALNETERRGRVRDRERVIVKLISVAFPSMTENSFTSYTAEFSSSFNASVEAICELDVDVYEEDRVRKG